MKILLITPPFTQLNTPYPATAYLKAFLQQAGHTVGQMDLSLETFLRLYSREFLAPVFDTAAGNKSLRAKNPAIDRMAALKDEYLAAMETAVAYLQGKAPQWTHAICYGRIIPRGHRFEQEFSDGTAIEDWFGIYGLKDSAAYAATLCLYELADFIHWTVSSRYGFSRYAPALAASPGSFDLLWAQLTAEPDPIDRLMETILNETIAAFTPDAAGITVPFPGNLYAGLRCGALLRHHGVPVVCGGGFVSTELRSLTDPRVFDYWDWLVFDEGELPFLRILEKGRLLRTKHRVVSPDGQPSVRDEGFHTGENPPFGTLPPPDYSDLDFSRYIGLLDSPSPMQRMWSETSWLKYTLAHGCYWAKCAFCDTSLDYIGRFVPKKAEKIADDLETMIAATGMRSFHFVDEAAPPALIRNLCIELIERKISVTWWTNLRFENGFTRGLARLMALAGCAGVAGGVEAAHPRVLKLINKGVELETFTRVLSNFAAEGILTHAYLMYAFPGQTPEEVVDSLDTVRQLFAAGLLSSAYWHRFNCTAHSPVGLDPGAYGVTVTGPDFLGFARNALEFDIPFSDIFDTLGPGLARATERYMKGRDLDTQVHTWFTPGTPPSRISPSTVSDILDAAVPAPYPQRLVWPWPAPVAAGTTRKVSVFRVHGPEGTWEARVPQPLVKPFTALTGSPRTLLASRNIPDFDRLYASAVYQHLLEGGLIEI